jgi:hypothetical protein
VLSSSENENIVPTPQGVEELHVRWVFGLPFFRAASVSARMLHRADHKIYSQDARSSMLFHYHVSGDDRLARKAISTLAASVMPDGILHGRYPAHKAQIILGSPCSGSCRYAITCSTTPTLHSPKAAWRSLMASSTFSDGTPGNTGSWSDCRALTGPSSIGTPRGIWAYLRRTETLLHQLGRAGLSDEYLDRAAQAAKAV